MSATTRTHNTTSSVERDHKILRSAARKLAACGYRPLQRVECEFHEGVLTLRGKVPTYYLKQLAQSLMADVSGVQLIHNRMDVVYPAEKSSQG